MKKCFPVILAVLMLIVLLPLRALGEGGKKLTLMVYMCGSNLESGYGSATADIQEMLGHRDISSTHMYSQLVKKQLKDVYNKAHPRA